MASSNVDLVRSIYAAWERGDYTSLDWAHPDMQFVMADGPTPGSWSMGDIRHGWRTFLSAWEGFRVEVDDYREIDDERVLVLVHWSGRGKMSGFELERMQAKGASIFHVRDGKVTRQVLYFDRQRALAELGLS